MNDVSFIYCSPFFVVVVLADWVGTFKWMNMAFSTTYEAVIITIQLRNTSSTKINLSHQTFTSHFFNEFNNILCPINSIIALTDFGLFEVAPSSEWIWSYKPLNWVRINLNKMYASPLPRWGGFRWRLNQSCSKEIWKVVNLVIHNCDNNFTTINIFHVFTF